MKNFSYKCAAVSLFLFASVGLRGVSHATAPGCTVNDYETGDWARIENNLGDCPFPGAPIPSSAENGLEGELGMESFRIEGRYKMYIYMTGDGWDLTPPSARPACLEGYAEAFAKTYCVGENVSGLWKSTYKASSTLCTHENTGPNNFYRVQYVRYIDKSIALFEWRCNGEKPVEITKNNGPPMCPVSQLDS
jgi:hypothetical protein